MRRTHQDRLRDRPSDAGATFAKSDRNPSRTSLRLVPIPARSAAFTGCGGPRKDEADARYRRVVSLGQVMKDETEMSAEPQRHSRTQAADPAQAVQWLEGELALPQPFMLESGASLSEARLAWQCVGPTDAPVVVVLGGISAHRRAVAKDGKGWWESQCGAGKALDINRYRLLSIDWLGGCDASTGPCSGSVEDFPQVSTGDQARALLLLLNRLGVRRVHLVVGAS